MESITQMVRNLRILSPADQSVLLLLVRLMCEVSHHSVCGHSFSLLLNGMGSCFQASSSVRQGDYNI